jgi:hypothetical protein
LVCPYPFPPLLPTPVILTIIIFDPLTLPEKRLEILLYVLIFVGVTHMIPIFADYVGPFIIERGSVR